MMVSMSNIFQLLYVKHFESNNVILYTGIVVVEINTDDGLKEINNGSLIPKKSGDLDSYSLGNPPDLEEVEEKNSLPN